MQSQRESDFFLVLHHNHHTFSFSSWKNFPITKKLLEERNCKDNKCLSTMWGLSEHHVLFLILFNPIIASKLESYVTQLENNLEMCAQIFWQRRKVFSCLKNVKLFILAFKNDNGWQSLRVRREKKLKCLRKSLQFSPVRFSFYSKIFA